MKKLLIASLLLTACAHQTTTPPTASAPSTYSSQPARFASHQEAAEYLISQNDPKQAIRPMMSGIIRLMRDKDKEKTGLQTCLNDGYYKKLEDMMVRESEDVLDKARPELVRLYMQEFSKEEMEQLMAFYNSPLGRKTKQSLPRLMGAGMDMAKRYTDREGMKRANMTLLKEYINADGSCRKP